ncbi:DNA-binding transcriptional regulator, AcrR family [Tindallia magadiensis]|uniref:DNA-binding transcriptional regulator, AcrR family n=1 Tax=Tindallia magadiensis TaxID=69895 RepID=A0A1I3E2C6_9FIRM|nr:TetR/AcrR family transcriptional regulator [Tindallia magadiensis]SFH93137.1 DNA-binding transcriptional regulator, AcrR family [Tindallia magadiensis]
MTQTADPQERKKEFMETALKLFNEKGYDKTTINDIIKAMGVSKGAFYHYFASKEDVIEQISDDYAEWVLKMTGDLADRKDLKAVEKINQLFKTIQGYKRSSDQKRSQIKKVFQNDQNLKLERKILNKLRKQMAVSLEKMIRQGIESKEFRQINPRETTEFIQFSIQGLNTSCENLYYEYMTKEPPDYDTFQSLLEEKLQFYEEILAQILQVPPGTIQIKEAYWKRYMEH